MINYVGMTYFDSDIFKTPVIYDDEKTIENQVDNKDVREAYEQNKEDAIRLLGYDPFEKEAVVDQPFLYANLIGYLDASSEANEDRMRVDTVPHAVDRLVRRFARERDIHLPGMKVIEHHGRRAIQDADADVWIVLVERLEPGEQIGLRNRVARADDQLAGQQLPRGGDLFLAALEQLQMDLDRKDRKDE